SNSSSRAANGRPNPQIKRSAIRSVEPSRKKQPMLELRSEPLTGISPEYRQNIFARTLKKSTLAFGVSVATTNDTRRHPRISSPSGTLLAWRSGSTRQVSRVANLSLGGLGIHTTEPPPAGTFIQLLLDAPVGQIRARAMVQWSEPHTGMGVKLVAMEQEDHARLANWLKRLSS